MLFCVAEDHSILASLPIGSYQPLSYHHYHSLQTFFIIITGEPKTFIIFAGLSLTVD